MAKHQTEKLGAILREVDTVGEFLIVARDFAPRVNFQLKSTVFSEGQDGSFGTVLRKVMP